MATNTNLPVTPLGWPHVRTLDVELVGTHVPWIESQLASGGIVKLMRGMKVIAELHAPASTADEPPIEKRPMPDFLSRMKAIWGETPMDTDITQVIREDRDARG